MNDQHDLTVILRSRFPIEKHEESRVIGLLELIGKTAREWARHRAVMANG